MNAPVREPHAPPASAQAHAREALPSLGAALGLGGQAQGVIDLFEVMTDPWGSRPIEERLERPSSVAEDQSPYAFSFTLSPDGADVGFMLDAQADEPSPAAQWSAGRALTKRLSERYGLALAPVARVEDLFEPQAGARTAVWHAAVSQRDAPPRFEVIFDAHAQGRWKARAVVEEALVRLGLGRLWPDVAERVLRRGPYLDDLAYLAIEIPSSKESGQASVKLYVRHHEATPEDLRAALGGSPLAARAEELCLALTGSLGPYRTRPLISCYTFTDPGTTEPSSFAIYVPVAAHAPSDAVVRGRVSAYLALLGLPYEAYEKALDAYARRPLAARAGLQSYVGLREDARGLSVTVELCPEVRAVPSPAPEAAAHWDPPRTSVEEIARRFENDIKLEDHPFLRRLAREPVRLGPLWLMLACFWEGIVHDFPKRLSHVIAQIDDDRIRCVLTKQLNDELGEGDFARAHKPMFQRLLKALEPHRLEGTDDVLLAPGRAFGRELAAMMYSPNEHEALGAMMIVEIYGNQTDAFMGSQVRRQDRLEKPSLQWLELHEGLEVDHAQDSFTLARCVPDDPEAIAAAWRGAEAIVTAGRHYFDAFYRICFA